MRWPPNKAWTSTRERDGYRHFAVKQFGGKGTDRWIELYPVLQKKLLFRVSIAQLKNQNEWISGWEQLPNDENCNAK